MRIRGKAECLLSAVGLKKLTFMSNNHVIHLSIAFTCGDNFYSLPLAEAALLNPQIKMPHSIYQPA